MANPSRRVVLGTSIAGAASALTAVSLTAGRAAGSGAAPGDEQTFPVPGLREPVTVTVDTWGVPHIAAANLGDLFLAQGFTVARERLFQIDLWRRRGLGLLSEVLGPDYVEQDRAARLFLYRGDMDAEWDSYGPDAREAAERFAAGINAYVDWLRDHPDALPPEFRQLGYDPARWEPEDVVRIRTHAIGSSLGAKVTRAKLVCRGGVAASAYFKQLEPDHTPQLPEGLDPCSIPDDVLAVYNLATSIVMFTNGRIERLSNDLRSLRETAAGSNAWAVAPSRTATGRPILAGDPHREDFALPGNRYITHLKSPELNIIGAGEPWNPGVSMGHNGHVAFGLTNLPADQSDLYVYELDPDDPTRYRYLDGWEEIRTVTEEIPVAGEEPRTVELAFTRHGPVVKVDADNARAYAVRTTWTEPGTSPYLGSLNLQRARNLDEFTEAMAAWKSPGSNLVCADTRGDIGWVPGALVPRRTGPGYDGLLPVPGDGRYEWDGFYRHDELPTVRNPREGFFASANEFNFPPGYPIPTYQWQAPYRKRRIDEVLAARSGATVDDSLALQNDEVSQLARDLLPYLAELDSDDPTTAAALALLRDFDGVVSRDSAGAALFETWLNLFLYPAWANALQPPEVAEVLLAAGIDMDFRPVVASLAHPEDWFGEGGAAARDRLLLDTLAQAFRDVAEKLGDDPSTWRWGAMHIHQFAHPLGEPTVGPVERGGSFHTVRSSYYYYGAYPYAEVLGATFKMALDVGEWDNSRAINAPGQSGDPTSPHFDDLYEKWSAGEYFPLLYSDEAIAQNAESRIILQP